MTSKLRIKSLDALKGFAIFAVICLHVVQPRDVSDVSWRWQIFNQVCRFAVPCFFLVAGFFFRRTWGQNPAPGVFIRQYAVRLLKPFLFWALFYAVVPPFVEGAPRGIGPTILQHFETMVRYPHTLLLTGFVYHLWFLSALLQAAIIVWVCLRLGNLRIALGLGIIFYALALCGGVHANDIWILHRF